MIWEPKDLVAQLYDLSERLPCMGDALGWSDVALEAAKYIERQLPFQDRRAAQIALENLAESKPVAASGAPKHPIYPCAGFAGDGGPDAA